MLAAPFHDALVLTGPTGAGKTALALELAPRLRAEIIAMDSMTLYRGMDIGTAKPTPAERQAVPHHLIDVLAPWQSANVAWWLEHAKSCAQDIEQRGRRALFVGGTPLYLKALLQGLFSTPPILPEVRRRLETAAREAGSAHLHAQLARVDHVSAARLHPNDAKRIVRALEVYESTGQPISVLQKEWQASSARLETHDAIIWLNVPRATLYPRINQRVDAMFDAGLVEEVQTLMAAERPLSREASQAVGYQEVMAALRGDMTWDAARAQVKLRSRRYAKHQETWLRRLPARPADAELTCQLWQEKMMG